MPVRFFLSLFAAKLALFLIKTFSLGSGSTWPGHVAMEANPQFLKQILKRLKLTTILIAGTNGKTTTAKMLSTILEKTGAKTFQNEEGANLLNGITTAIIKNTNLFGHTNKDIAILEVDEGNLSLFIEEFRPDILILLNLFRDQLDRYGEVNTIAQKWKKAIHTHLNDSKVFLNADDPLINFLGKGLKNVTYFGLPHSEMNEKTLSHDVDSVFCPECQELLDFERIAYSHLGDYKCPKCGYKKYSPVFSLTSFLYPLLGVYNKYNVQAASVVAFEGFDIGVEGIKSALGSFKPAFGRQEEIIYKGKKVVVLLSKNPTGFNQSLDAIKQILRSDLDLQKSEAKQGRTLIKPNVLLVLNDRIPDGQDVSWIWDTEAEELLDIADQIFVSGDRVYDMALRVKYACSSEFSIFPRSLDLGPKGNSQFSNKIQIKQNLNDSINTAIKHTGENQTLFILPTYSAMLEVRKILTGKEML